MGKKRIYELAKELNVTSKQLISSANSKGISVHNHMSTIDDSQEKQIRAALKGSSNQPASHANAKSQSNGGQHHTNSQNRNSEKRTAKNDHKQGERTNSNKSNSNAAKNHQGQAGNNRSNASHSNSHSNNHRINASGANNNNNNSHSNNRNTNTNNNGGNGNSNGFHKNNRKNKKKFNKRNNNFGNKYTKNQRIRQIHKHNDAPKRKDHPLPEVLEYTDGMNAQEIGKVLHREPAEIVKKLFMLGVMVNQNKSLDKETIELLAADYGIGAKEKEEVNVSDLDKLFDEEEHNTAYQENRPPVVTIMGHVDHGKTTLLDYLRHSHITSGEAGGITQGIGAYQVQHDHKTITFLDTPGHAAFTAMRARGADITDITILVVAADDGVMPQTVEAINHAKAAKTPIIVAINKIDKPGANPDHVTEQLSNYGLIPEDWGGDTIFVKISAKFGNNVDELLDMILLQAEVMELKANPKQNAAGSVIEARLDRGKGTVATLLVQQGTMHVGDPIVVGDTFGRVRTMVNEHNQEMKEATPSTPVGITGLNDVPEAGDRFIVFDDEKTARTVGEKRAEEAKENDRRQTNHVTLDNLFDSLKEGEMKQVDIIIKADVQGSVEALSSSLQKIEVEGVKVNIIHTGVGAINESDVALAEASNAIIIGFNVRPTPQAKAQAESDSVDIRLHQVIYDAIDEVESAMKGLLEPTYKEEVTGQVEVREIYKASKVGTIAGGMVISGYISRDSKVRLIRDNVVVYDGELGSLKRFKDDAKSVKQGFECGLTIENYNDIKVNDVIEAYVMKEVPVE
ncbi:translation initiation factor IF-2 [Lactobacillus sp. Sy-1]|uniref:translation initiation factor IF-2 n=1 Tax=Lactobacillus sp. Sy-1 TaxID=2109645 RepID=UPI001C58BBA4|nr:translation initiation factor IF-2 [Lactobacillus sp. Sy-1]MBW1605491.1 translation initiation factor IF-2 [Lactobacillus sp. Sy-1]